MRMRRHPGPHGESGATMLVMAIALVAMLGMVALVVDVGGMLITRRRLVTAADSAALAAAESCAKGDVDGAGAQADSFAADNVPESVRDQFTVNGCGDGAGTVTVAYHAPRSLYFAPVLGFGSTATITATSQASWAPAAGAPAIPIEVSTKDGVFPCMGQDFGTECNYWHDQSNTPSPNDSDWGFMNFDQWDVTPSTSCHNPGTGNLQQWIHVGEDKKLEDPGPTYVCVSHGHEDTTWSGALRREIGQLKVFPVNDPDQAIWDSGNQKYAIVGFAELRIKDVLRGDNPVAYGSSSTCTTNHDFTTGEVFDLDTVTGSGCPNGVSPQALYNLKLTGPNGNHPVDPTYYRYDDATHQITWLTVPFNGIKVVFDWSTGGGKCGIHAPDSNAVCVVATWEGYQIGGDEGVGGLDFGLRTIRLSD
jgi:Flp pilus assembly protein TadG